MALNEDLDVVQEVLGDTVADVLVDGLPDGADEDLGFDEALVKDIARACLRWRTRMGR